MNFWTTLLHLLTMSGAAYISAKYPAIAPYAVPVLVGISGVAPSPMNKIDTNATSSLNQK